MLSELCGVFSIFAYQEHWLHPDKLSKMSLINCDFEYSSVSDMNSAYTRGILAGRPFGDVAFLWHKSLSRFTEFLRSDSDGKCLVSN